jgi:DGQHR domain-containing protein
MIWLPVFAVTQPVGTFYIGVMSAADVCAISRTDVRRLINQNREVEQYLGIQRHLDPERKIQLEKYVNTVDAAFPTGIILAVDERCATLENGILTLAPYEDETDPSESIPEERIAKVLDGQHRLAGLLVVNQRFDVNVAIFIGADIADQATIFATVNLAQTKVNKSLAYDLYEYEQDRSPQKTCHNIAVNLDQKENSPLYHRIKRLGIKTEGREEMEFTSQANFVQMLLPHITADAMADRDLQRRQRKLPSVGDEEARAHVFRRLYAEDKDAVIAVVLWNFFDAVKDRWNQAWGNPDPGWMLTRTNGFRALMRFVKPAYLNLGGLKNGDISYAKWKDLFDQIDIPWEAFTTDTYPPGTGGESKLFKELVAKSGISESGR